MNEIWYRVSQNYCYWDTYVIKLFSACISCIQLDYTCLLTSLTFTGGGYILHNIENQSFKLYKIQGYINNIIWEYCFMDRCYEKKKGISIKGFYNKK